MQDRKQLVAYGRCRQWQEMGCGKFQLIWFAWLSPEHTTPPEVSSCVGIVALGRAVSSRRFGREEGKGQGNCGAQVMRPATLGMSAPLKTNTRPPQWKRAFGRGGENKKSELLAAGVKIEGFRLQRMADCSGPSQPGSMHRDRFSLAIQKVESKRALCKPSCQ